MPKTILLADDSVTIQKVIGISFANEDVVLLTVDNGNDAVLRARQERPDIVLADIVMPGKSGYEVCQELKSDPALRHVPVLLLSGTFECFDEGRAEQVGADGHITKPFEAQILVEQVNALLAKSGAAPTPRQEPEQDHPESTSPPPLAAEGELEGGSELYDLFDDELPPLPDDGHKSTRARAMRAEVGGDSRSPIPAAKPAEALRTPLSPETVGPAVRGDAPSLDPTGARSDEASFEMVSGFELPDPTAEGDPTAPQAAVAQLDPAAGLVAAAEEDDTEDLEAELFGELNLSEDLAEPIELPEIAAPPEPIEEVHRGETSPMVETATATHTWPTTATEDPVAGPPQEERGAGSVPAPELAGPAPASPSPAPEPAIAEMVASDAELPDPSISKTYPDPSAEAATAAAWKPELRRELKETLEKVAWDALGDLSERIVREAVERVEAATWEVVPQLAEILIREEIRRIKGEA